MMTVKIDAVNSDVKGSTTDWYKKNPNQMLILFSFEKPGVPRKMVTLKAM